MKKYFQAPWNFKELIIPILISGLLIAVGMICMKFFNFDEFIEKSKYKEFLVLSVFLIQWIILFLPLFIYTKIKHKIKLKHFGIKKVKILKTIGLIIGGYIVYLAINFIILTLIVYTGLKIQGYAIQEKIIPQFGENLTSLVMAGFLIVILGPIFEEIFFRGFVLRSVVDKIGIFYGSIISAAIFALFHLQFKNIIPIFILGLIINSIVIKSKSIIPSICFHVFNNAIAFTIEILIIKDIIQIENFI